MFFGLFNKKEKSCLGIDFGASGIKIVELSRKNKNRIKLTNYAIGQTRIESNISVSKLSADQIAALLKKLFERANIRTKQAVFSLSVGETFSTIINLPQMSEEELVKAIPFQARKYVPIPIEEVVLDWSVVGEFVEQKQSANPDSLAKSQGQETGEPPAQAQDLLLSEQTEKAAGQKELTGNTIKTIQVLIVAVPQEVIRKIAQIAKKCELKVLAIEQEAFSMIRALVGNDESTYLLVDLGQDSVDLIIMDKNSIRLTYTFETDKSFDLLAEAIRIINLYQARYQRKVGKVILTGGGVTQSNWIGAFADKLKIPVGIGDPFARVAHDKKLDVALKEMGPFMAVAVGGAMREI
jgi:type IV pilus assembly protein PilM